MKNISKIFFFLPFACILFWVAMAIALSVSPVELDQKATDLYLWSRLCSIPVAIILTLFSTLVGEKRLEIIFLKIMMTAGAAWCVMMLVMIITMFGNMCEDSIEKVLYKSKNNSFEQIVLRSFGCGATDSTPATESLQHIKYIIPHILLIKERNVDTATIDHSKWKKVNE